LLRREKEKRPVRSIPCWGELQGEERKGGGRSMPRPRTFLGFFAGFSKREKKGKRTSKGPPQRIVQREKERKKKEKEEHHLAEVPTEGGRG